MLLFLVGLCKISKFLSALGRNKNFHNRKESSVKGQTYNTFDFHLQHLETEEKFV